MAKVRVEWKNQIKVGDSNKQKIWEMYNNMTMLELKVKYQSLKLPQKNKVREHYTKARDWYRERVGEKHVRDHKMKMTWKRKWITNTIGASLCTTCITKEKTEWTTKNQTLRIIKKEKHETVLRICWTKRLWCCPVCKWVNPESNNRGQKPNCVRVNENSWVKSKNGWNIQVGEHPQTH